MKNPLTPRRPFEGVLNIVRFNWPMYLKALSLTAALLCDSLLFWFLGYRELGFVILLAAVGSLYFPLVSLLVSYWIYDLSHLYSLNWLDRALPTIPSKMASITAGFDEISTTLQAKYPNAHLELRDFYDSSRHTEPSIARARAYLPPSPITRTVHPSHLELEMETLDLALGILAWHEIRSAAERKHLFDSITPALQTGGRIVMVEHLRNLANFAAFGPGAYHFFSRTSWLQAASNCHLKFVEEWSMTPFINVFVWEKL